MHINKICNDIPTPNFQARIVMEPKVLKYLIDHNYENCGEYLGLFDFKYSPLEQRKIIYNILKHIKKTNPIKPLKLAVDGQAECGKNTYG